MAHKSCLQLTTVTKKGRLLPTRTGPLVGVSAVGDVAAFLCEAVAGNKQVVTVTGNKQVVTVTERLIYLAILRMIEIQKTVVEARPPFSVVSRLQTIDANAWQPDLTHRHSHGFARVRAS